MDENTAEKPCVAALLRTAASPRQPLAALLHIADELLSAEFKAEIKAAEQQAQLEAQKDGEDGSE